MTGLVALGKRLYRDASSLLRQHEGKLTQQLQLRPSPHNAGLLPARLAPENTTTSVCGFCSTGCGLKIQLKNNAAINLSPSENYPVNRGKACPKGWEALSPLRSSDRGTTPLLRSKKNKALAPVNWDTAGRTFTQRFRDIQKRYGAESVAFISTGQMVTEEMAYLGVLAKFGMGIVHGDGNTRQCMATAVTAYKESFGFDAPPYSYADFEESDVLVFVGANPCVAHPIMWERVSRNPHNPTIIVIDPRTTDTALAATQHLTLKPQSDLTLMYGIANLLIENAYLDHDYIAKHCNNFAAFAAQVKAYPPERVVADTGITPAQLATLTRQIGTGKRVSFWWTMGVNQNHEGVRVAQAIINLALMTGNMGRPGTGANSITGQCNAMGSRLFSNTTNLLGGHDFQNAAHRAKIAEVLGIDAERIPTENSLPYHKIIEGISQRKIRGLWIIATNPVHSWINQLSIRSILGQLDFLVVQDMYANTETVKLADLYLPAAGWGEKEGTFINSERRIGLVKPVSKAPGEALSDFRIFRLLAKYWGTEEMLRRWETPEAVFKDLTKISRGQPCDISGIEDYAMLDRAGGIQWPCAAGTRPEENPPRLFGDGKYFHPDGRARFCFGDPTPVAEPTSERYPFCLLTGRGNSAQWHTRTRTRVSPILRELGTQDVYIEINRQDASRLGITDRTTVMVTSRRGVIRARAYLSNLIGAGQVFMPMHFVETNQLTFPAFDPHSQQPAYKACAVDLRLLEYWEK